MGNMVGIIFLMTATVLIVQRVVRATDEIKQAAAIRVACIGDSITFVVGTKDHKTQSYPAQLAGMLGDGYTVGNFGVSGATMLNKGDRPYQQQKALARALDFKPDIVVIVLGTNDSKTMNWPFHAEFPADTKQLAGRFMALESKPKIYLCYPAPAHATEAQGINDPCIRAEQPMIDAVARKIGAHVIDLHTPLADKPRDFPDGIHPNSDGAQIIALTVYRALTGKDYDGPLPPPMKNPPASAPASAPHPQR
jgi:acyl-CoA thioesterase I